MHIRCVHGDVRTYSTGETSLEVKGKKACMKVGVAANLPYDIVLGRDWPFFPEAMKETTRERNCTLPVRDSKLRFYLLPSGL